jgi:hypothetical protein
VTIDYHTKDTLTRPSRDENNEEKFQLYRENTKTNRKYETKAKFFRRKWKQKGNRYKYSIFGFGVQERI